MTRKLSKAQAAWVKALKDVGQASEAKAAKEALAALARADAAWTREQVLEAFAEAEKHE